jgi:alkaline phosphatase D
MFKKTSRPAQHSSADPREAINDKRRDFLEFLLKSSSSAVALAVTGSLAACGGGGDTSLVPKPATFAFGVASGDPLTDRVILWTHAKIADSTSNVALTWQVATDIAFANIVKSGRLETTEASGFTGKVDATGLTAGNSYFYRFVDDAGSKSSVGITRTLVASSATSVKLAVFSCALYSEGYFHAYDSAAKSDAQYAIHLGDYIYEYGSDPVKFGNSNVPGNRIASPANDIVTMNDYRTRYALYRSDLNLQALHAKMPWITVWDDHEFANNAYAGGAENHNPATQGDWTTRKNIAAKVYHEWMPIRTDFSDLLKIYRRFDFGSLFTLHMLDTRIEGRVRQYANFGDPLTTPNYQYADYVAGLTPGAGGIPPDAVRTMISTAQQNWLTSGMAASTASWQFLGNQDIMARMWFPASVLNAQTAAFLNPTATTIAAVFTAVSDYLTAKATRAAGGPVSPLLNTTTNPKLPYNLDSWDGYPIQRETILQTVKAQAKRLVTLSGDSHNGWFTQLTTLANEKVGVEFAGTSVSAPGFESAGLGGLASSIDGSVLVPQLGSAAIGAGLGLIDDVGYCDTVRRGYLLMTVTAAQVKGEYVFVSDVKQPTYTATVARTVTVSAAATGIGAPVFS